MIDTTVQLARPIASLRVVCAPGPAPAPAERDENALAAERAELARAHQALTAALNQAVALRNSVVASAEQQIVQLALDVARKVLMQEIQAGRYEIDPIVRAAMEQVTSWEQAVVHVSPADFQRCSLARQAGSDRQSDADPDARVRFVADAAVKPAECFIETRQGVVRSSVAEHLGEIASALAEPEQA